MSDKVETSEQPIELPSMYFNGFQIGITNSDVSAILLLNGQPQFLTNFSYTTAKTLHAALGNVIGGLEGATGHTIMTTQEIEEGLKRVSAQNSVKL